MREPLPWYTDWLTAREFLLGMLTFGKPLELSVVGAFEEKEAPGVRGSRRDIELPPHRDGVYSAQLAAAQGGTYVEKPGIDIVGLYCLRGGTEPCFTTICAEDGAELAAVNLSAGQALIFDNRLVLHGRRGLVGDRVVLRMWIQRQ